MKGTLYCGDIVLAGQTLEILEKGAVFVEQGRIVAVDRQAAFVGLDADTCSYPALVPGFIDCHDHLALDAEIEGWAARVADPESEHMLRAMSIMRKDLYAGVTTARCPGDKYFVDVVCRRAQREGLLEGPRLVIGTRGIKASHAHGLVGYAIDGVEPRRAFVRENLKAGADFLKLFITDTVWTPRQICYPMYEEIAVVIDEAHRVGKPVAAHCTGGPGFDICLDAGLDVFEHGYFMSAEQVDRLIDADKWLDITATPIMSDYYGCQCEARQAEAFRNSREELEKSMRLAIAKGAKYALGSDGLHGLLCNDMAYLVDFGASPLQALRAATIQGARLCGLEAETGSLEAGKCADIVGLGGNPVQNIGAAADVRLVVQEGRVVRKS